MAYAKVLGAHGRQDGYLEGSGYIVSWCIGHLVELAPPSTYDEKYVKWNVADLRLMYVWVQHGLRRRSSKSLWQKLSRFPTICVMQLK